MRKKITGLMFFFVLIIPFTVIAGGDSYICDTKYPVVLAHGMGASAQILGIIDNFWGIQDALAGEGCDVYATSVNGMDSTRAKAEDFRDQFLQILAITGASKGNIIGHSHGTLYTRDAISNLGLSTKVASHSSLAGPHRGSAIADAIAAIIPDSLEWLAGGVVDFLYAFFMGDTNPDSVTNAYDLTRPYMINTFNPNTPDMPGVYYQSWAAKIKTMAVDARNWYFIATWPVLLGFEGANDGLVSVTSAKWGNFRGIEEGAWYSAGVDHVNIVGHLFGFTPGFNANEFFIDMVAELKDWGY